MALDKTSVKDALEDARLNMPQRVVYSWILLDKTKEKKSVTIHDIADAFGQDQVTAGNHLNALERLGILTRFLPFGGRGIHHWRLCAQ